MTSTKDSCKSSLIFFFVIFLRASYMSVWVSLFWRYKPLADHNCLFSAEIVFISPKLPMTHLWFCYSHCLNCLTSPSPWLAMTLTFSSLWLVSLVLPAASVFWNPGLHLTFHSWFPEVAKSFSCQLSEFPSISQCSILSANLAPYKACFDCCRHLRLTVPALTSSLLSHIQFSFCNKFCHPLYPVSESWVWILHISFSELFLTCNLSFPISQMSPMSFFFCHIRLRFKLFHSYYTGKLFYGGWHFSLVMFAENSLKSIQLI